MNETINKNSEVGAERGHSYPLFMWIEQVMHFGGGGVRFSASSPNDDALPTKLQPLEIRSVIHSMSNNLRELLIPI